LKKLLLAEVDQCNRSTEDQHKIFIFVMILKMKNERQAQANGNGNDDPLDFDDLELSLADLDISGHNNDENNEMDLNRELDDMELDIAFELGVLGNEEEEDMRYLLMIYFNC